MLLYATLTALLACSGLVSAAPAPDTGGASSNLYGSSKASVATVAYQEVCYLTLFDAEDVTSLRYGKDTLAQDENGQDVYINDGYKKDSSGREYYYEEACYKSSKVDGKTQSNTATSSSTTDGPFSSLIGTLGLDDGVSGFLSGLVSGDNLGLGGLVRFVKRQFDGKTIGAILGQPAAEPAASSSSSAPSPNDEEDSATPSSPDFFDASSPTPTPTPTPTITAAPSPTAVNPLEIANGFGGIQSVGNALPGRIGAEDILGPAFSSANATPMSAALGATTTQDASPQSETPDAQPSTSAFTPAPGPPGYPTDFTPAAGPPGSPLSFTPADGPPSAPSTVAVNANNVDDAAPQATQFQPASPPPTVQVPASTFIPAAAPPTQNVASPATTQQVQPAPSSPIVQTAAPPVNSPASFFTPASSVVTPTIPSTLSPVAADTPTPVATSAPSSTVVDTPATSSIVPLRIYVAAASPSSSSVDAPSTTSTSLTVISLAPTAVPAQSA